MTDLFAQPHSRWLEWAIRTVIAGKGSTSAPAVAGARAAAAAGAAAGGGAAATAAPTHDAFPAIQPHPALTKRLRVKHMSLEEGFCTLSDTDTSIRAILAPALCKSLAEEHCSLTGCIVVLQRAQLFCWPRAFRYEPCLALLIDALELEGGLDPDYRDSAVDVADSAAVLQQLRNLGNAALSVTVPPLSLRLTGLLLKASGSTCAGPFLDPSEEGWG